MVVTGMGVVSPLGHEVDTFYNSLLEGKSGVDLIESFDTGELEVVGWLEACKTRTVPDC